MASGGPRESGGVSVASLVWEISEKETRYNVQLSYKTLIVKIILKKKYFGDIYCCFIQNIFFVYFHF